MMMLQSILLIGAIQLTGVTGNDLRARAFFDANNVKVGDPLTLTIDFLGDADFKALHPPALSRFVNRKDWKLDDASAKTDTYRDARRLTYRVRPMRDGVLWFPALEFEYEGAAGESRLVKANDIPVHAKVGSQVVVDEIDDEVAGMPAPPPLKTEAGVELSDDMEFDWRKALANPSADAFAKFDFAAAKLNEAREAIRAGEWARALSIYYRLEWKIGQTADIERGIVAALALKYDSDNVELPMWRQVGRPVLRYGWRGRAGIAAGGIALVALVMWLVGRGIRAVACVAAVLLTLPASSMDIFEQMEQQMQQMRQRMHQQMQQMGSFGFGEKEQVEPVSIVASVATSKTRLQVGEPFEFIVSLEAPKTHSIELRQIIPSEEFGMTVVGRVENLEDAESANSSNIIRRLSVPVRYDVPFKGPVSFRVEGMVSGRQSRNGGRFSFTFSNSFACETKPIEIDIRPLPTDNQPAGFGGIVSEGMQFHEYPDLLRVETNDVITLTYRMRLKGYLPKDFLPPGAAFEWTRTNDDSGRPVEVEYRRFMVADGTNLTPKVEFHYYDPRIKSYRKVAAGGTHIEYVAERKEEP